MSRTNALTLCCRIMLMALCVTCSFAPAWAATFVAAKAARVPHGRKAACIHGRPACAFVRQSRPKAPLREPFLPLLAPLHAALPCGGGRPQSSLTLAPAAVKAAYFSLSTVNLNRAFVIENICRPAPVLRLAGFTPPSELYAASQLRRHRRKRARRPWPSARAPCGQGERR